MKFDFFPTSNGRGTDDRIETERMTISTAPFVVAGAEALLRIGLVSQSSDQTRLSVESGRWLRDSRGAASRAALGVALDDATGYVVASNSPPGKWPVSLGIRVDFLADPPMDGSTISVTGELVTVDGNGGTTRGFAADESGAIIALVTQRSHLIEVDSPPGSPAIRFETPTDDRPLSNHLGIIESPSGIVEMPPTPLAANGRGSVHGGILIYGSEVAALAAIDAGGEFRTTSIDIVYVRPCNALDTTIFRTETVHRGKSLAVVRVISANSDGRACSIADVVVQRPRPR